MPVETPDYIIDNFSQEYHSYLKERVSESPLVLEENPFFPELDLTKQESD